MITSINEFKQFLNEGRLPHGFFRVVNQFSLPTEDEWDLMFNKDNIIEIDTKSKQIKKWSQTYDNAKNSANGEWVFTTYPYLDLMMYSEYYRKFKQNTVRLAPEDTPEFAKTEDTPLQFTTTVKRFPNRALELGLDDGDKVKVTIL